MPARDGLIILERYGLKMSKREAVSANQQAADEFPDSIKKITEKKAYQPEEVFNSDENALLLKKKMPQKTFISKEEKQAPEFRGTSGRERLTALFCSNAARFVSGLPSSIKLLTPKTLREKKHQLPVFWYTKRYGQ